MAPVWFALNLAQRVESEPVMENFRLVTDLRLHAQNVQPAPDLAPYAFGAVDGPGKVIGADD
jgi:hypothetical protein